MVAPILPASLLGLVACIGSVWISSVSAQSGTQDLGTVLQAQKNLSIYYELIKTWPDILLKLPSYNGVTIIAPSNAAFDNIPGTQLNGFWNASDKDIAVPILEYHILQGTISTDALTSGPSVFRPTLLQNPAWTNVTGGQNVMINKQPGDVVVFTSSEGTRTTQIDGDIKFSGGLIQIIDNLLIPPAPLWKTADSFKLPGLIGALFAAKLMPDIAYQKDVTIFAPRDAAFKLVGGSLEGLDQAAIKRIMTYHIVPNKVLVSSDLTNGTNLTTAASAAADGSGTVTQDLHVIRAGNNLFINSAQVVQPDILIANGVLHIIDSVLNPDVPAVIPNPEIATQPPVFAPSSVSSVPFASAIPCTANCPTTTSLASVATKSSSTSSIRTGTSPGAAPARCTGMAAGVAMGVLGAGFAAII